MTDAQITMIVVIGFVALSLTAVCALAWAHWANVRADRAQHSARRWRDRVVDLRDQADRQRRRADELQHELDALNVAAGDRDATAVLQAADVREGTS